MEGGRALNDMAVAVIVVAVIVVVGVLGTVVFPVIEPVVVVHGVYLIPDVVDGGLDLGERVRC
tara:strand:+ start:1669 stop:1857 length:189 start_codon:yes stop_codon:yes gene_type:complete